MTSPMYYDTVVNVRCNSWDLRLL